MESILLPSKIQFKKGANSNESVLELEPCHQGYGITIGNALRRVLLSSLPGAAITSVKFDGLTHEFSAVPNVAEDALQVILNLKQVRIRSFSDEPVKLTLRVSGEKEVTAGDFEKNSQVEIVNPDQKIATTTDSKAEFKMEVMVEKGRGYLVTEDRDKSNLETGMIAVDAIFTPVRNVSIKVDNVRVGQITNYDKLTMVIETDGTISPESAVSDASQILINHFQLLAGAVEEPKEEKNAKKAKKAKAEKEEGAAEEAAPEQE
ncbi:MAG: DNA-directed RNA polymerase subunit alpha [bacterium]